MRLGWCLRHEHSSFWVRPFRIPTRMLRNIQSNGSACALHAWVHVTARREEWVFSIRSKGYAILFRQNYSFMNEVQYAQVGHRKFSRSARHAIRTLFLPPVCHGRSLHSLGRLLEHDQMAAVDYPVDHGRGHLVVGEYRTPPGELKANRHGQVPPLVALGHDGCGTVKVDTSACR